MKYIIVLALIAISVVNFSCKEEKMVEEKNPVLVELGGDNYADIIRTPVNPDGTLDSTKMPRIKFEDMLHNFGKLEQVDKRKHTFLFTNSSELPLYILDVNTSCGCTVASYSEDVIAPGENGEINLDYDPKNKKGIQEKKVIVTSNAFPNKVELTIIADVIPSDN